MKLFISYARVDKPLCKQIVHHLEDVHEVWYDKRLHAGQGWWDEIQERLAWCEGFVYLLSPESVASEYCQKEFDIASTQGKHLFPVLIQARTAIPPSLSHIHYADLSQGMEDILTLMNAIHIAEVRQLTQKPAPVVEQPMPKQALSPTQAIGQAADAMESEHYDNAVFILKSALEKAPDGRNARILQNMLREAEAALERQTYLREAAREYAPLVELASRASTRSLACEEFVDFQRQFPDYDPEKLADTCAKISPPPPTRSRVYEILPAPFDWIDIPAGKVTLENKKDFYGGGQTFEVPAFAIAKYPITNAQFARFIEAGGYKNRPWWTEAGWDAREKGYDWDSKSSSWQPTGKAWTAPRYWNDKKWNGSDYPVVGVSWYEAVAFCRWLSDITGENVLLPTEQHWQRAAQGNEGRTYPWGNEWDRNCCNNNVEDKGSGQTTPVTHYEGKGDSPFGVVDMAGNVWEWCLTDYETGSQEINISVNGRVLRGGSWCVNGTVNFRAAFRYWDHPYDRNVDNGFRCARSFNE